MYILVKDDGTSYYLKKNKSYTVGRIDVDIALVDKAVSRRHAEIIVRNNVVLIKDLKSSNGTSVNGTVIKPNTETELKECQQVLFGNKDSIFTLKRDVLVITTSGIGESEKQSLKTVVEKMNGSIAVNWSEQCTHVVVSSFVLTIKVLSALILKQAIVTCRYFDDRLRAIEQNVPLPDPNNYRPKVLQENLLRKVEQVDYDADRTRLFENKTFVFPSVDKKKMESVIKMAGGKVVSYEDKPIPKNRLLTGVQTEYLFVISSGHSQSEESDFNECVKYIHRHGKRSIPMQEIAMALLICSCKVDCNPNYNKVVHLVSGGRPQIDTGDVLVEETQSQAGTQRRCTERIIPPTFDGDTPVIVIDDDEPARGEKRPAEIIEDSICKKKKPDSNQTPKRPNIPKFDDEPERSPSTKRKSEEASESIGKKSKFVFKERKVKPSPDEVSLSQVTSSGETKKDPIGQPLLASTQIEELQDIHANDSPEERISPIKKKPKFPPNPFEKEPSPKTTAPPKFQDPFEIRPSTSKDTSFMSSTKIADDKPLDRSVRPATETKSFAKKKSKFDFDDSEPISETAEETTAPMQTCDSNLKSTTSRGIRQWLSKLPDRSCEAIDKMDDEMREFVKSFQTNVKIISTNELVVRKPMSDISVNESVDTSSTGKLKNFKKFKKIRPKHEQSRILPKTAFQKFVCNATDIVSNFQDQSDITDCIEVVPTQTSMRKTKNAKNKFQLKF